ncbi:MAG: hypothetical protein JWO41_688 [Candidatus Saccharibacteria bacterium]|nr:hypothetical protein [Candidatus Saccharibacteria bacterium]
MINPAGETQWRPKSDCVRHYELQQNYLPLEAYVPIDAADAMAYLRELALPELVAYDGHPVQEDLMREMAAAGPWSYLFPEVVVTEPIVRPMAGEAPYAAV